MIIKIIVILLLVTGTTIHCVNLALKKDKNIAQVKNNSKMEDFYSHVCESKADYLRCFTRRLLKRARKSQNYDLTSAKIVEAFEGVDDIAATKIKNIWRSDIDKNRKVWIAECETENPRQSFYLHFVKKDSRLVLDVVN